MIIFQIKNEKSLHLNLTESIINNSRKEERKNFTTHKTHIFLISNLKYRITI